MRRDKRGGLAAEKMSAYARFAQKGELSSQVAGLAVTARDLQALLDVTKIGDSAHLYGAFRSYVSAALRIGANPALNAEDAESKVRALGAVLQNLTNFGIDTGHVTSMLANAVQHEVQRWKQKKTNSD